jgi:uncharacterized phage protein (TIGR01671 family)
MSREIKFRAWDYENKKWVFGWLTKLVEGIRQFLAIVQYEDGELVRYYIDDEKTVGQFTGLHDKNGKEIYEGDILDFDESEWGAEFKPEAVPTLDKFTVLHWPMCGIPSDIPKYRQVIGNIHENPELLENKS